MDLPAFEVAIKTRSLVKPFYLFSGNDEFLKERTFDLMVSAMVAPEDTAENVLRLDLAQVPVTDLLSTLGNFTFNESPRLFSIVGAEALPPSQRTPLLERFAAAENFDRTYLVFLSGDAALASELGRKLKARCEKIDIWTPFENKMVGWVQKEALEAGAKISSEAAEELLDKTGRDLRLIVQELGKLALQVGKGGAITGALVNASVGYLRQDSVFDLLDAFGLRDAPRALRIAENLLSQGQAPLRIWTSVCNAMREFRLIHDLSFDRPDLLQPVIEKLKGILRLHGKSDYNSNQERKNLVDQIQKLVAAWPKPLADGLLPNPRKARNLAFALNYTRIELADAWPRLVEMDSTFKSSPGNVLLLLQECLLGIISPKSCGGRR